MLPRVTPIDPRDREPFDDPEFIYELKHDGWRGLAHIQGGKCWLMSKKGKRIPTRKCFRALGSWLLQNLRARSAVVDGELVCLDDEGRSQFYDLQFDRHAVLFYTFDLLYRDGVDIRRLTLMRRRQQLRAIAPAGDHSQILVADHVEANGEAFFEEICRRDLEGILATRKSDPYGESTKWWKIRNRAYSRKDERGELFNRSS